MVRPVRLRISECPRRTARRSAGEDEHLNLCVYVDDGRLYWDPTKLACEAAALDRKALFERFSVKYGDVDPKEDFFLGASVVIQNHVFIIDDMDEFTLKFMEGNTRCVV